MIRIGASSKRALKRVVRLVSDTISLVRGFTKPFSSLWWGLERLTSGYRTGIKSPSVGDLASGSSLALSLQEATHVVIVCLSYPGMEWSSGQPMSLTGTKNDLQLILRHLGYRHQNNSRAFDILTDFNGDITDACGVTRRVDRTFASKEAIKGTIERILDLATANSKLLFFFSGHGTSSHSSPGPPEGNPSQNLIAGDEKSISGEELRSWLCGTGGSVAVTAVIDACHSGGSLGLPYTYAIDGEGVRIIRKSSVEVNIPMLQISAARSGQLAHSGVFEETCYGRLTYTLIRYLESTKHPTIEGLVSHLYTRCGRPGEQLPQRWSRISIADMRFLLDLWFHSCYTMLWTFMELEIKSYV